MKEVGIKLKVGTTGQEQLNKLNADLGAVGKTAAEVDSKADALGAELLDLGAAGRTAAAGTSAAAAASGEAAPKLRATAAAAKEATGGLDGVAGTLRNIASVGLAGVLGSQTAQMLRGVAETADAYSNLQARIKLVTGEGEAFTQVFAEIGEIALRTNSNLEGSGTLFARIAQAGKEIGVGQGEALALTESINQAIQLSGASAAASDAAITQLVQGLQSGVLRGDEFNSVMEQAPRLASALAAGLGVTTGELRKMAEAGQLSSATVIKALQSQSATLQKEFATLPATVGRSLENLNTKWTLFIGQLNQGTGATASVAAGINALADNLDEIAEIATRAGTVLVAALAVQGVGALRSLAVQMAATTAGAGILSKSLADIPKVVNIAVAAVGFEVGFQIGDMLRENSALARKLGVGITEFLVALVNDLKFLQEAAAAVFTDDTVGAAFDRFRAHAEEQQAIFKSLYEEAEQAPSAVRAAASAAAAETEKLGATGQAVGVQLAAAGAAGAAGLASTTAAAETAGGALQGLLAAAGAANKGVSALGTDAERQADALVKLALAGSQTAATLGNELPEALSKLSGTELEQFRAAMVQSLTEAIASAQDLGRQLQAAGKDGSAAFAQADQAGRLLGQVVVDVGTRAAQALGVDLATAGGKLSKEFSAAETNLAVLIRSMPALQEKGVDAAQAVALAIGNMIDGAKTRAEVDLLVTRLQALGVAGQLTGEQVAAGLELTAQKANQLREAAENTAPGIQSIGEAARKAGVDVGLLTTGLSKGFSDSVKPVSDLLTEVIKTGTAAERASPVLAEALNKRIEAAQTKEELALVVDVIERGRKSGKLFGDDLEGSLERAKRKAQELSPALQQAQRDAELLGVTLRAAAGNAEQGSVEMIRAYERLKASGKATADEINRAFVNTANAAIQSAGGVVPEWVKVEAAMRGARIETDRFGNAVVLAGKKAGDAGDAAAAGFGRAAAAAKAAEDAALRYGSALKGTQHDAEGFALDGSGGRFTAAGQLSPPDDSGGWEFVGDVRVSGNSRTASRWEVPGQGYWRKTGGSPGAMLGSAGRLPYGGPGFSQASRAAAPAAEQASSVRVLQLDLGGGRRLGYAGGSAAELARVEALLRALEREGQRAAT